ncbi:MAG: hypothetical protein ACI9HK_004141 [Pirellulaceae bacterium]|jgi:hypothetical protein
MAVSCAICGEELLGSVNRCWKCGNFVTSRPGDLAVPPVRTKAATPIFIPPEPAASDALAESAETSGVGGTTTASEISAAQQAGAVDDAANPADAALSAEIVDGGDYDTASDATASDASASLPETAPPPDALAQDAQPPAVVAQPHSPSRTQTPTQVVAPSEQQIGIHFPGSSLPDPSPPSQEALDTPKLAQPVATSHSYIPPMKPAYSNSSLATAGAFSSLVLGMIALVASYFTIASLFPAVLGIAMGIWGIFSNQRTVALIGLAFCVVAFGAGLFGVAIWIFESIYGISPFDERVIEIPN